MWVDELSSAAIKKESAVYYTHTYTRTHCCTKNVTHSFNILFLSCFWVLYWFFTEILRWRGWSLTAAQSLLQHIHPKHCQWASGLDSAVARTRVEMMSGMMPRSRCWSRPWVRLVRFLKLISPPNVQVHPLNPSIDFLFPETDIDDKMTMLAIIALNNYRIFRTIGRTRLLGAAQLWVHFCI